MKYAKKMLKIPESEYYGLLNLVKNFGGDPLKVERAILDAKILENLNNPNINEDLKGVIHQQLFKERRALTDLIENKPQRVIIDNPQHIPNIAPYLGITNPVRRIKNEEGTIQKVPREIIESTSTVYTRDERETDAEQEDEDITEDGQEGYEDATDNELEKTEQSFVGEEQIPKPIEIEKYKQIPKINITPNKRKELENYISKNISKFPITTDGRIIGPNGYPIENSNFRKALDYFEGKSGSPKGKFFLERKIMTDPNARRIIGLEQQHGKGKRKKVLVKLKTIRTPGLLREPQNFTFKPQLWPKL